MCRIFGFFFFFGYFTVFGQLENERRIIQTLCSPAFHGRGYVNQGDSIAASFIADEFKKMGLKPLKKSFFQSFSFDVNTFPGEMTVNHNDKVLKPGIHFLVDPGSSGGSYLLNAKPLSIESLLNTELLSRELQLILKGSTYNAVCINLTKISPDTLKKINGISVELASLLPVIEVTKQKFTWSVSSQQLNYPLIQIQDSVFRENKPFQVNIEAKFIQNHHASNVIAYLPASKKSNKTIVFSAHYDHLGQMGNDAVFPGANDNASGTGMLLSLADYFSKNPMNYNIVFIAFAGEEAGLLGSKYFVEHPMIKLEKINFLVNLDIMGSGEEGVTVVNATLFDQNFQHLLTINQDNKLLSLIKPRGPAANSDHYWFTQKGVPAFFIYTMGPNKNYHDVNDTYENLTFSEFADIKTLLIEFTKTF